MICSHCKGRGVFWCGDNNTGRDEWCTSCDGTGKSCTITVNAYNLRDILKDATAYMPNTSIRDKLMRALGEIEAEIHRHTL